MRVTFVVLGFALLFWQTPAYAQPREVPPIEVKPSIPAIVDSVREEGYFTQPNTDSARIYDSVYAIRRAEIMARMKETPYIPHEEFFSARLTYSAFGRIRARDIQQYFAERVGRIDLADEGDAFSGIDRMISLLGELKLSNTLGVFAQYSYTGKNFQTNVLTSPDSTRIPKGHAELDLVSHDFTVGPAITPFSTSFVRLKMYAGLGPAVINITEYEESTKTERQSSANGLAIMFEAEFDFRIVDEVSFGLTLYTKQLSTSEVEANDVSISSPFGSRTWTTETIPEASYTTAGLGLSLHFYF